MIKISRKVARASSAFSSEVVVVATTRNKYSELLNSLYMKNLHLERNRMLFHTSPVTDTTDTDSAVAFYT